VYFQCPSDEAVRNFTKAVKEGIITWHAGPMNMQFEFIDESLLTHALDLSLTLDKRFGIKRKFRTLSQRDVPGNARISFIVTLEGNLQESKISMNLLMFHFPLKIFRS
jgi:hypothetical protein